NLPPYSGRGFLGIALQPDDGQVSDPGFDLVPQPHGPRSDEPRAREFSASHENPKVLITFADEVGDLGFAKQQAGILGRSDFITASGFRRIEFFRDHKITPRLRRSDP